MSSYVNLTGWILNFSIFHPNNYNWFSMLSAMCVSTVHTHFQHNSENRDDSLSLSLSLDVISPCHIDTNR